MDGHLWVDVYVDNIVNVENRCRLKANLQPGLVFFDTDAAT